MHVSQLYLHPVKSLGGIPVEQFEIDRFGPYLDRRWLVVDENGHFMTQRQYAAMAQVRTALSADGQVTLSAPGCVPVSFCAAHYHGGVPVQVTIWRDRCDAVTGPAHVDVWLSQYLGVTCRLVHMPENSHRLVDPAYAESGETVSFADGFPLLLISEESLQDLNRRMSIDVGMERFRPNLVVKGTTPFGEDDWRRIRVGDMTFTVAKPCSRCAIPTIDPVTAQKQPEVFKTLKSFRGRDGAVYFGQNLLPEGAGMIRVGDAVQVLD